jgi:lysophospholipase L1-like esterase
VYYRGHSTAILEVPETTMRARPIIFLLLLIVWNAVPAAADPSPAPIYYLALGDSLSLGVQPTAKGEDGTDQGYADNLFALYRLRIPNLRLAKLGCSGETTSSMIAGGVCDYRAGSQLAQALRFIRTHDIAFITLDIGADNIVHCISLTGVDQDCLSRGVNAAVMVDMPQILAALRAAAPGIPIVGMNYYDPFLAAWGLVPPPNGPRLAVASWQVMTLFNTALEGVYRAFGVPVAQVAAAFRSSSFTPVAGVGLPLNVVLSLTWTWMALPAPRGPDIHPNAVGYAVIASAFARTIGVS